MIYLLLPVVVGAASVLQNTINKRISESMGLALALLINSVVVLALSVVLFVVVRLLPDTALPELFRQKGSWSWADPKLLVPSVCGFLIIAGAPWAISRLGATKVFILMIVAQILVSLLWDYWAESLPVSPVRLVGAALTLLGALLVVR